MGYFLRYLYPKCLKIKYFGFFKVLAFYFFYKLLTVFNSNV